MRSCLSVVRTPRRLGASCCAGERLIPHRRSAAWPRAAGTLSLCRMSLGMRFTHGSRCVAALTRVLVVVCGTVTALSFAATPRAHAQTAVIRIDGTHQRVNEQTRMAVEAALAQHDVPTIDAAAVAERYRHAVPQPRYDDAAHAFVNDAGQRAHAVDRFFTNDFPPAIAGLSPWLDVLESDPSVLARNPQLAPTAFHSMLTLARAYTATGADANAADALARTVRLFWFAELDPLRHPPALRQAVDDARALTPVREIEVALDRADCTLRVNGIAVPTPGRLTVPLGTVYVQAGCSDGDGAVHRLKPHHTQRTLSPRLDAITRADDAQVWLEPAQLGDPGLLDALHALRVLLELETLIAVRWETAPHAPSQRELVLVRVRADGEPATVRLSEGVYPTLDPAALVAGVAAFDPPPANALAASTPPPSPTTSPAPTTEGIASPVNPRGASSHGRPWTVTGVTLTAAATAAATAAVILRGQAVDAVAACRQDTVGCVLAGELDAQRADVSAWHRRSTVLWGTAAGLATGTVIALVLETKRERRNATLGVAASTRGARATLRVRF